MLLFLWIIFQGQNHPFISHHDIWTIFYMIVEIAMSGKQLFLRDFLILSHWYSTGKNNTKDTYINILYRIH